ncbi:hypothetical protein Z945_3705 [Sulfitobacter noctilucae]|nr:hypothetical protein Z945_3705 [Sulfitobacter noctilucae]
MALSTPVIFHRRYNAKWKLWSRQIKDQFKETLRQPAVELFG